jgi:hypothetical protein
MDREEAIDLIRPILQDYRMDDELQRLVLFHALAGSLEADAADYRKAALSHWVQEARKDPYVYEVLVEVVLAAISRGHPLTAPVLTFVCDVMRGKLMRPTQTGDKHKSDNALRDHRICVAIWALERAEWQPIERNAASEHTNSACDLVGEVLWPGQKKFSAVQTVWSKRKKRDVVLYATPSHWYE